MADDGRPPWDETWLNVAFVMAARSKCVRSKVGAVIVDETNHVVSTAYNGPPGALPGTDGPCSGWCARAKDGVGVGTQEFSACESLHGEQNSLLNATHGKVEGGTIFVTRLPCISCSRAIAGARLRSVVWFDDGGEDPNRVAQVTEYLESVGIDVRQKSERAPARAPSQAV